MPDDNTPKNENSTKSNDSKIEKFSEGSSTVDNSNLEIIRNQTSTNDSTSSK